MDQMTTMPMETEQLLSLYDEAKDMLTEAADYFGGSGSPAELSLTGDNTLAYAEGSKCITARLMEVMAWLFVQRAVMTGEMSAEESLKAGNRLATVSVPSVDPSDASFGLPQEFCSLDQRCGELYNRVQEIDNLMNVPTSGTAH